MDTPYSGGPASALIRRAVEDGAALTLTADETWLQGRSLFGGLQFALALRAARQAVGSDLPLRSVHATFLAPVLHDAPVVAEAKILRAGRSVTHVKAQLRQADNLCFECTAILGSDRETAAAFDAHAAADASPEAAFKLRYTPGIIPNFIQHYDVRWARGKPPFSGTPDPSATIFVRPADETTRYDETEFLAATDVIPPPVLSLLRTPAPASSMNCAVELIRPEAVYGTHQWLRFEVELHDAHSGYAWQTSRIYGEDGALLALAHQSVAVFG